MPKPSSGSVLDSLAPVPGKSLMTPVMVSSPPATPVSARPWFRLAAVVVGLEVQPEAAVPVTPACWPGRPPGCSNRLWDPPSHRGLGLIRLRPQAPAGQRVCVFVSGREIARKLPASQSPSWTRCSPRWWIRLRLRLFPTYRSADFVQRERPRRNVGQVAADVAPGVRAGAFRELENASFGVAGGGARHIDVVAVGGIDHDFGHGDIGGQTGKSEPISAIVLRVLDRIGPVAGIDRARIVAVRDPGP